jgi:hypothetical protein
MYIDPLALKRLEEGFHPFPKPITADLQPLRHSRNLEIKQHILALQCIKYNFIAPSN